MHARIHQSRLAHVLVFLAALGLTGSAAAADRPSCTLIEGVKAELLDGPRGAPGKVVTLKSSWAVEYRWNIMDKEAVGWMRITDEAGQEVGWLPPGHDGITCGNQANGNGN